MVNIRTFADDSHVHLEIADNGPGAGLNEFGVVGRGPDEDPNVSSLLQQPTGDESAEGSGRADNEDHGVLLP